MNQLYDRITAVEDFIVLCNSKFDGFGKELVDLSTDVRTVLEWISQHFGTELDSSRNRIQSQIEIEISASPPQVNSDSVRPSSTDNSLSRDDSAAGDDAADNESHPEVLAVDDHFSQDSDDDGHTSVSSPKLRRARQRKSRQASNDVNLSSEIETRNHGLPDIDTINNFPSYPTAGERGHPCKPIHKNKKADPQPSQCDQCGKILKDVGSLRQHKVTHKDLRPHVCPECGKAFRRKFHLKTHSLIHSGEKKHQCGYCGKLFLLPKDLVAHERTHTGERPYSCQFCPKSFNLKSHLKMHVRTHTGEKPYKCDVCEKAFSQSNSLRVHKKVHLKNQMIAANSSSNELLVLPNANNVTVAFLPAPHRNNLCPPVEAATCGQDPHGRPSTSTCRDYNEPVQHDNKYNHLNHIFGNCTTARNEQLAHNESRLKHPEERRS